VETAVDIVDKKGYLKKKKRDKILKELSQRDDSGEPD